MEEANSKQKAVGFIQVGQFGFQFWANLFFSLNLIRAVRVGALNNLHMTLTCWIMCVREDGKVPLGSGVFFVCDAIVVFMSLLRKEMLYVHLCGKSLWTDCW